MVVLTPGQVSQAIAKALKDRDFRSQLLANPKATLQTMDIPIPATQAVRVLESTHQQSFFVLPMMTEEEVTQLNASFNSALPQRSVRANVLLRAWQDSNYKQQLIKNPKAVLTAEGMKIPQSTTVTVLENTPEQLYLILPSLN